MSDRHALVHYGTQRHNWTNRHNLTDTFADRDGQYVDVRKSRAPGIHFGVMDANSGGGVIFRVGDVTLNNAVALDWDRYDWPVTDRGVSPNGKRISDALASRILDDVIAANPEQAAELGDNRHRILA